MNYIRIPVIFAVDYDQMFWEPIPGSVALRPDEQAKKSGVAGVQQLKNETAAFRQLV